MERKLKDYVENINFAKRTSIEFVEEGQTLFPSSMRRVFCLLL